eukprot:scaffold27213_cov118-Isochrysis_galbana.AAC.2
MGLALGHARPSRSRLLRMPADRNLGDRAASAPRAGALGRRDVLQRGDAARRQHDPGGSDRVAPVRGDLRRGPPGPGIKYPTPVAHTMFRAPLSALPPRPVVGRVGWRCPAQPLAAAHSLIPA